MRGLAAMTAFIAIAFATDLVHARQAPEVTRELRPSAAPRPAYAKAFAMGFEAVLADYHWIKAVQLVGDPEVDPVDHAGYLGDVVDVVTTLDPWVDHPYRFAAVWLTDSAESVRRANALLRRGIEYHPGDWRNYFYLGFNHFFYLGENAEAADALERAAGLPGSPAYLGRLVVRLRSEASNLESAEVFLRQLIRDTQDLATRAGYQAALDEIEIEHRARLLDHARQIHHQRHGRDIESVEELLRGDPPVLARLPDAEPSSLPPALRRGAGWMISESDGRIVSSHFGRRYEVHMGRIDRERREAMRREEAERGDSRPQEQEGS